MPSPSGGWKDGAIPAGLGYAASNGGDARGLQPAILGKLARLGFVEIHPTRHSTGKGRGLADVHQSSRLTQAGCKAAGIPWRVGVLTLVFGKLNPHPDHPWGHTLTISARKEGLRIALVPVAGALPPKGPGFPPTTGPEARVETHSDPAEAMEAIRTLVTSARSLTGGRGRIVDPGYLAWDGEEIRIEDIAVIEAGEAPGVEEILDRLEGMLRPSPAPGF